MHVPFDIFSGFELITPLHTKISLFCSLLQNIFVLVIEVLAFF